MTLKLLLDKTKLQHLVDLIHVQTELDYINRGFTHEVHLHAFNVTIKYGNKYTRIDRGDSGCYMIDNMTGVIYGIKAYGVVHKGHAYGTLDTVDEWNWGGYTAVLRREREAQQ